MGGEDPAVRLLGAPSKEVQSVTLDGVQPELAATADHRLVAVDADRADARFAQQLEKLASAAAGIDDIRQPLEPRQVPALALPDLLGGAAEPLREPQRGRGPSDLRALLLVPLGAPA